MSIIPWQQHHIQQSLTKKNGYSQIKQIKSILHTAISAWENVHHILPAVKPFLFILPVFPVLLYIMSVYDTVLTVLSSMRGWLRLTQALSPSAKGCERGRRLWPTKESLSSVAAYPWILFCFSLRCFRISHKSVR